MGVGFSLPLLAEASGQLWLDCGGSSCRESCCSRFDVLAFGAN
jgi:hypothetical protein